MVKLLSWVFSIITFPGIVVHEIAHRFFCDFFGIPVYNVDYFNFTSQTAGSVTYKRIYKLTPTFFINIAPLIINTIGCILFTLPYQMHTGITGDFFMNFTILNVAYLVLAWIGVSMGVHAIPSSYDLKNITEILNKRKNKPVFINTTVSFLEAVKPLRYLGLDLIYAYLLSNFIRLLL